MKAKPKSFALAKFQQAGQLAIAKNKAAKVAFLSPFPAVRGGGLKWKVMFFFFSNLFLVFLGGSRCLSFVYESKALPC